MWYVRAPWFDVRAVPPELSPSGLHLNFIASATVSDICNESNNPFVTRYKARHAHKRLYTVLPGITSCRLVKDNKQAIELNSLLLNNMPKDGYG